MQSYAGRGQTYLDIKIHKSYFPTVKNGICLECGALDGERLSVSKAFEEIGWKSINIEADRFSFLKLCINRPDSINLHYALSDKDNETLTIQCSKKHPKLSYIYDGEPNIESFPVMSITYRKLVKLLNLDHLNLFILDVEEHEPNVIRGMRNCNILPDIFCIEAHTKEELKIIEEELKELKEEYVLSSKRWQNYIFKKASFSKLTCL